jgi:ABC-type oligopeptide transport system ATPase subunit
MQIKTIEISGFISCFHTLRKPYKKQCRSKIINHLPTNDSFGIYSNGFTINLDKNDLKLLQKLIKNGDEHAKAVRLINVTVEITATRSFWHEMVTYEVGVTKGCSESTIHTILSENLKLENFQNHTLNEESIKRSIDEINIIKNEDTTTKNQKKILIKEILPESYLQTRDINFSYQTLQRIVKQRDNHTIPDWGIFIEWIKSLPLSEELIFCEK